MMLKIRNLANGIPKTLTESACMHGDSLYEALTRHQSIMLNFGPIILLSNSPKNYRFCFYVIMPV